MDIRISGDAVEGYTLENAYRYDSMELRYLLSWLPKAIKATRKELNRRAVEKRPGYHGGMRCGMRSTPAESAAEQTAVTMTWSGTKFSTRTAGAENE